MTFEINSSPHIDGVCANDQSPLGRSLSIAHVENPQKKILIPTATRVNKYENLERQRWEDEGGANASRHALNDL